MLVPWRLPIRHPSAEGRPVVGTLALTVAPLLAPMLALVSCGAPSDNGDGVAAAPERRLTSAMTEGAVPRKAFAAAPPTLLLPPSHAQLVTTDPAAQPITLGRAEVGIETSRTLTTDEVAQLEARFAVTLSETHPPSVYLFSTGDAWEPEELWQLALDMASAPLLEGDRGVVRDAGLVLRFASSDVPVILTEEIVVEFSRAPSPDDLDAILALGLRVSDPNEGIPEIMALTPIAFPPPVLALAVALDEHPLLEYAYPNLVYVLDERHTPTDAYFHDQWHHQNTGQGGGTDDADIDSVEAWDLTLGSTALVVAVIDSGFDITHPDLAPNLWWNPGETTNGQDDGDPLLFVDDIHGWDFLEGDASLDGSSHGTLAAGCVGAATDDVTGVVGSAPLCRLMMVRRGPQFMQIVNSIHYPYKQGADILTNSWGYKPGQPVPDPVAAKLLAAATFGRDGDGCIVLFSMSNENKDDCCGTGGPGCVPDISALEFVIGVSGVTNDDRKLKYTGRGHCMDVLGPADWGSGKGSGGPWGTLNVVTTDVVGSAGRNDSEPGTGYLCSGETSDLDYTYCFGGTSAAAPVAAGVCGLILAASWDTGGAELTRLEVQRLLQDTCDKVDTDGAFYSHATGHSPARGFGRINSFEAVRTMAPTANGGRGGVDIFLRDNWLDWGNTQRKSSVVFNSPRGFEPHWESVDVKVVADPLAPTPSLSDFATLVSDNPVAGALNRVFVRVRNRGPRKASNVQVKLHWSFAGTALPALPADFWSAFPNDSTDTSIWHPLGVQAAGDLGYSGASVAGTGADAAAIVAFDFLAPAIDFTQGDPTHHCLMVTAWANEDPIDPASMTSTVVDWITPRDNNVTQLNVHLVDPPPPPPAPPPGPDELSGSASNPFAVRIETELRIDAPPGWAHELQGIPSAESFWLAPGEERRFRLSYERPSKPAEPIRIVQVRLDGAREEILGGFTIRMRDTVPRRDATDSPGD